MKNYPVVSIVFPTYNGWEQTKRCLGSIEKLNYPKNKIEVIVVDNSSTDTKVDVRVKNYDLRIIQNKKNIGFAKAVNIGIKEARGKYILVTNDDVTFGSNSIIQLFKFLNSAKELGIVGPEGLNYNFWLGRFKRLKKSNKPIEADWIAGYAMLFPKLLWKKLNHFDEGFFFTGEDADFCLRAKYLGYKSIQLPNIDIKHQDGATVNKPELKYFKYYEGYMSKFRLILKHGSFLQILSSFFLQIFVYTPYRALVLKEKSTIAMIKALWTLRKY